MNTLHDTVMSQNTLVVVGSGGVGKTTTSAVIALHAALHGRKVMVLTIDPAKRLANSLGLEGIDNDERQIPLAELLDRPLAEGGELWAMMLDMKSSFDAVVRRNTDEKTAERILSNRIYQSFSSSLSGTQEYSAVERLCELQSEGRYDLIVLDTPPTRHALDFLDAPDRLYEALDNSALQWLYRPALASGKVGLGLVKLGARGIRKTLGKLTGSQLLDETAVFLESLAPLFDGLKERARRVHDTLRATTTGFLIVTSPDPLTIAEAIYFDERLRDEKLSFGGFVANRVHEPVAKCEQLPEPAALLRDLQSIPGSRRIPESELEHIAKSLVRNATDFDRLARSDAITLDHLRERRGEQVYPVPFYSTDIHSLKGLDRLRRDLFADV